MKNEILGVKAPKKKCTDQKCPFHGQINVKKEIFKGKVIKKDINRSATIEWSKSSYVQKYERYEIKRSRMRVHNPACIDANLGQEVLVARTRPLSKEKNHVIIQIIEIEEKTQKKTNKKANKESKEIEETNEK